MGERNECFEYGGGRSDFFVRGKLDGRTGGLAGLDWLANNTRQKLSETDTAQLQSQHPTGPRSCWQAGERRESREQGGSREQAKEEAGKAERAKEEKRKVPGDGWR